MGQVMDTEREQPGQKDQQPDFRSQLRRREPTVVGPDGELQVAAGNGRPESRRHPDGDRHRIAHRLGVRAYENPRPGAARLDLRQLEVVPPVDEPPEPRGRDHSIEIRISDRPLLRARCVIRSPGDARSHEPFASLADRPQDSGFHGGPPAGIQRRPFARDGSRDWTVRAPDREHFVVGSQPKSTRYERPPGQLALA